MRACAQYTRCTAVLQTLNPDMSHTSLSVSAVAMPLDEHCICIGACTRAEVLANHRSYKDLHLWHVVRVSAQSRRHYQST